MRHRSLPHCSVRRRKKKRRRDQHDEYGWVSERPGEKSADLMLGIDGGQTLGFQRATPPHPSKERRVIRPSRAAGSVCCFSLGADCHPVTGSTRLFSGKCPRELRFPVAWKGAGRMLATRWSRSRRLCLQHLWSASALQLPRATTRPWTRCPRGWPPCRRMRRGHDALRILGQARPNNEPRALFEGCLPT